jgi:zeaxanthin epoxidase
MALQSSTLSSAINEESYELLGLPARKGRPLKVAIAGGGVGGLTAALCLLKKGFDVTVYEKTAAFARFGGPIQFASNALSVLKEIDDTLFERVMEKFTFTGTRTCGIKDGLRADGSFRMTNDSLDYLWNPDAPADWFVKFPLKVRSSPCVCLSLSLSFALILVLNRYFQIGMCRSLWFALYWCD